MSIALLTVGIVDFSIFCSGLPETMPFYNTPNTEGQVGSRQPSVLRIVSIVCCNDSMLCIAVY